MIIDLNHPLAPHIVLLKDGQPLGRVQKVNTVSKTYWAVSATDESALEEGTFDVVCFHKDTPASLRLIMPMQWEPYCPQDRV